MQKMAAQEKGVAKMKKEMRVHEEELAELERYSLFLERKYMG